jgi:hypothetical protein
MRRLLLDVAVEDAELAITNYHAINMCVWGSLLWSMWSLIQAGWMLAAGGGLIKRFDRG